MQNPPECRIQNSAAYSTRWLVSYLVAPLQHIFLTFLHLVVDVQKLNDSVLPYVVGILLGFFPVQRRPLGQ